MIRGRKDLSLYENGYIAGFVDCVKLLNFSDINESGERDE